MEFPVLIHLLGCYFHQDWPEEYTDSSEALADMLKHEPQATLLAGAQEIEVLLASKLSIDDLEHLVTCKVGCFFAPDSESVSLAEWLSSIRHAFLYGQA
ncbi:contact-dependent growth inhibition system immunity protein [Pseudomonas sp. BJa3]|uniref:contact-dependent growth inhibition system immunity protein n=1 Tax=Pseudomonas sp. BJa3 TaxID=2986525 RepID=UPI0022659326|nr:contact-dependent growth inhibition system immunity protein [Pseudomonas sp. BJa3]MCX5510492.1 contact-dependent growth inhibition system immunity protein [Pseudomonas sp. BJa3]